MKSQVRAVKDQLKLTRFLPKHSLPFPNDLVILAKPLRNVDKVMWDVIRVMALPLITAQPSIIFLCHTTATTTKRLANDLPIRHRDFWGCRAKYCMGCPYPWRWNLGVVDDDVREGAVKRLLSTAFCGHPHKSIFALKEKRRIGRLRALVY